MILPIRVLLPLPPFFCLPLSEMGCNFGFFKPLIILDEITAGNALNSNPKYLKKSSRSDINSDMLSITELIVSIIFGNISKNLGSAANPRTRPNRGNRPSSILLP